MASCKDCIHERICWSLIKMGLPYADGEYPAETFCMEFENKADVVEVVRCKDCIYWDKRTVNNKGFIICAASGMEIHTEDFCSYGERRETNAE